MGKLNFTRWKYFCAFCKNIQSNPNIETDKIIDEIDFQINRIYAKTEGAIGVFA